MLYSINYDLKKPGRDYEGLYNAIKALGPWWHYLESTCIVETSLTASQVWERIRGQIDQNDRVLIVGLTRDHSGWLPKPAWDWLNSRASKAA